MIHRSIYYTHIMLKPFPIKTQFQHLKLIISWYFMITTTKQTHTSWSGIYGFQQCFVGYLSADPVCQGLASSASPMPPFALMRGICLTLQATTVRCHLKNPLVTWATQLGEGLKKDGRWQIMRNLPKVAHTYEIYVSTKYIDMWH